MSSVSESCPPNSMTASKNGWTGSRFTGNIMVWLRYGIMMDYVAGLLLVSRALLLFLWIGILRECKQLSHSGTGHTEPLAKNQIFLLEWRAIPFLRLFFAICFAICFEILVPLFERFGRHRFIHGFCLIESAFCEWETFSYPSHDCHWERMVRNIDTIRDDMNLLLIGGDGINLVILLNQMAHIRDRGRFKWKP